MSKKRSTGSSQGHVVAFPEKDDDFQFLSDADFVSGSDLVFSGDEKDTLKCKTMFSKQGICLSFEEVEDLNDSLHVDKTTTKESKRKFALNDHVESTSKLIKKKKTKDVEKSVSSLPPPPFLPEEKKSVLEGKVKTEILLPGWPAWLPDKLKLALHVKNFINPTSIQTKILEAWYKHKFSRDIQGCAPTGSGKTLAYLIPVLESLEQDPDARCLVIVPARELALQIGDEFKTFSKENDAGQNSSSVSVIVGGLAHQKQIRVLLKKHPRIIVATPGRLAQLLGLTDQQVNEELDNQINNYLRENFMPKVKHLVLDEADRLNEQFSEKRNGKNSTASSSLLLSLLKLVPQAAHKMLFSATLSKGKSPLVKLNKPLYIISDQNSLIMTNIVLLPETLEHFKIIADDKDVALFCLLQKSIPTLVFVNSIAMIRRIVPLFKDVLGIPVLGMHAQMQQRARLKALDKFKSGTFSVMIATDVIGRGIDLPFVDRVIHYQPPTTSAQYVHRAGRAGRAGKHGTSILIMSGEPGVMSMLVPVCHPKEFPDYSYAVYDRVRPLLREARLIEKVLYNQVKQAKDKAMDKKLIRDLGVDQFNSSDNNESDEGDETYSVNVSVKRSIEALRFALRNVFNPKRR